MLEYIRVPRALLGKRHVIYNGVDESPQPAPGVATKSVVLAVGTLHPRKGYETLLHAFAKVAASVKEAECRIVGGEFGDGTYGKSLRALASQLGVSERVHFVGFSANVEQHMRDCALLAIPSRVEAFGMVALEAMRCAKPVVACRTGGLKEIIEHGQTGALVSPGDADEMADAMICILENRDLATRWGAAGRQRVSRRFTSTRMVESFAKFYTTLFEPTPLYGAAKN